LLLVWVQTTQLILDIKASLLAQRQQFSGVHVQFAGQGINANFFTLRQKRYSL